ncbi:MAG: alpha-hydroxy acid oxidase [Pseudomonadota bacterium]
MLRNCHNISDLRAMARRRLPGPVFHYLDGAAEDEITARRNTGAFDELRLVPHCLVDVSAINTMTRVLGRDIAWPLLCSPTGASRLFHPDGELAVARAAAAEETFYTLSTASTYSLEDVAAATNGPKMFQVYVNKDRGETRALIERCKHAGYDALCLAVDVPVVGKRERDLRTGFTIPPRLTPASFMSFAAHPAWLWGQMRKGPLTYASYEARRDEASFVKRSRRLSAGLDPSVSWKDLGAFIDQWGGPFALKGILSVADAKRAVDAGVSAIIVSNHGGRQLDGAAAPIEMLPHIADAVGGHVEIILEGGVRRGVHVLKALALGATACAIGRPYLYGLGAGGQAGVARALEILRAEFSVAMKLAGCADLQAIDRRLIL